MTEENQELTWDEAVNTSGFVQLENDMAKILVLQNVRLEKRPMDAKVAGGEIELIADVVEEDGEVVEKKFTTTSKRLKQKLRPILEGKLPADKTKVSILRVGEKFNTQFSVVA